MKELSEALISGVIFPPLLIALASLFGRGQFQSQRLGVLTVVASSISFSCSLGLLFIFQQFTNAHPFFFLLLNFKFTIDALSLYFILLVNIIALFASYFTVFIMKLD